MIHSINYGMLILEIRILKMSDIPEFGVYKGMMTSYEESLKMSECSHQAAYEQSEDTWYCPYCESIISWEIEDE